MIAPDFRLLLRTELAAQGLLGNDASRLACAEQARACGTAALADIQRVVGVEATRRALSTRRGPACLRSYSYVAGYGALMTEFLIAPVSVAPPSRDHLVRLGAMANVIVSHFDEMVDGGWPRALLLPHWALSMAGTRPGRVGLRLTAGMLPASSRLIALLVAEYFARLDALPYAARHVRARRRVYRTVTEMYAEEGRTPREWRRLRGTAALQKKTALPLVVLGLPAWLAVPNDERRAYDRHRRWLTHIGKFIRWVDDAADVDMDTVAGASNMVVHARARRSRRGGNDAALAAAIARRGRRLVDEWRIMTGPDNRNAADVALGGAVLANVLVAWVGSPDAVLR